MVKGRGIMQKLKIYYAHSMLSYNTNKERNELSWLKKNFSEIVNPKKFGYTDMDLYLEEVKKCDGLIFSEYKDMIGKGIHAELILALQKGMFTRRLRKAYGRYRLYKVKKIIVVNPNKWKFYAKVT